MATKKSKNKIILILILVLIIAIAIITAVVMLSKQEQSNNKTSAQTTQAVETPLLSAHFIDVGQGDSTLFVSGESAMLIDSGEYEYGDTVISYLRKLGITELDYIVTTHAHSDHMGSMAYVIENIGVNNIIMSEPTDSAMSKNFYGDFLDAVENTDAEIILAEPDYTFTFGNAECTILSPAEVETDENNNSVVMLITSASASFLMTGDAEKSVEKQLLKDYPDLNATILKAGHHGSKTSSHKEFIETLDAETVIISVGKDNSYNHPSEEILEIYKDNTLDVYRTDLNGSIIVDCFKDKYTVSTEK